MGDDRRGAGFGGPGGRVVSAHSFRGGTGKSNTTANVAALLAASGKRVGVIEADIQSPRIHVLFGIAGDKVTGSLNPRPSPSRGRHITIAPQPGGTR
jgi:Mrp family chromosome partitioning ATPase